MDKDEVTAIDPAEFDLIINTAIESESSLFIRKVGDESSNHLAIYNLCRDACKLRCPSGKDGDDDDDKDKSCWATDSNVDEEVVISRYKSRAESLVECALRSQNVDFMRKAITAYTKHPDLAPILSFQNASLVFSDRCTMLDECLRLKNIKMLKYVVEELGADVNGHWDTLTYVVTTTDDHALFRDELGREARSVAAFPLCVMQEWVEGARYLLQQGAVVPHSTNFPWRRNRASLLKHTVMATNLEMLRFLVEECGVDVNRSEFDDFV
jgi:hypothetical protein